MSDRLADLETRIDSLTRELGTLKDRLDRLEARQRPGDHEPVFPRVAASDEPEAATPTAVSRSVLPHVMGLVGRTLMALGGGYLLRAVTETGAVPPLAGAVAGLVYAVSWLVMADRAGARGRTMSAVFHGAASAMIAYPLTWETTVRFGLLAPGAAATLVPVLVGLGLVVAWRQRLAAVAWTHGLAGLATAEALLQATHSLVVFTAALLAIAVLVEGTAMRDRWLALRWPTALVLDLAVLQTVLVSVRPDGPPPGYPPIPLAGVIVEGLALPLLYLVSVAVRTIMRRRDIRAFEIIQIAIALAVGFGGTLTVARFTGRAALAVGVFGLLLGAACYAAAFVSVERRTGRTRNFYVYTTFAAVLILVGTSLMLGASTRGLAWASLGMIAAWLGGRYQRMTLRIHGAVYLAMSTAASGLLQGAIEGLIADGSGPWHPVGGIGWPVGLAVVFSYVVLARTSPDDASWQALVPQAGLVGLGAILASGFVARVVAGLLANAPGPDSDLAALATSRTAAVAATALALTVAGRQWGRPELIWLVYPLLALGGVRLLFDDLPHGRPGTLFVSFAAYGGVLFAVPRLLRREEENEGGE